MRKYTLLVPEGDYTYIGGSRFPLLRLGLMIVRHRFHHWLQGEGWVD